MVTNISCSLGFYPCQGNTKEGLMEIREETRADIKIITLQGRLDAQTSPTAEKRLLDLTDLNEHELALDLSGVTFVSSGGLALLLKIAKKCAES